MKLLRCYIQNYGKLHEFSYDFDPNLSEILQQNGWGKSTFASFIKAMLFGLPQTTKHDIDQNERKKFTPWQGGVFGGWLEFTMKDNPYRIERTFGKTQSSDTVTIYDLKTNKPIQDSDFIQKSLGINADTFARSTFVGQGIFSDASDESIKAKLGKLIQDDDSFDLKSIDAKLDKRQTTLKLHKGKGGKIYELEEELDETTFKISEATTAKNQINLLDAESQKNKAQIEKITENIQTLRDTQSRINAKKVEKEVREHHQTILRDIQNLKKERAEIIAFFISTPPTDDDIKRLDNLNRELENAKIKLSNLDQNSPIEKIKELDEYFIDGIPTEQDIAQMNQKLQYLNSPPTQSTNYDSTAVSKAKKFGSISLSISAILIVLGIILLITFSKIFGGILLGLGILGSVISLFKLLSKDKHINKTIENNKEQQSIRAEIVQFVSKYHEDTEHLEDALYNIHYKIKEYERQKNATQDYEKEHTELTSQITKITKELTQYYATFFDKNIDFAQNYRDILAKTEKLKLLDKDLEQKTIELNKFEKSKNLSFSPIEENTLESIDEEVLRQKIVDQETLYKEVMQQQTEIQKQIDEYSRIADTLAFYKTKEESLEEQLSIAKYQLEVTIRTREFLDTAKNNLTARYLAPLCQSFTKYAQKLLGKSIGQASIDTNLNILIDEQGSKKDTKFFSQGTRDIIELCLRLALIDVLFDGDLPPLILDDPFYNLDDSKTTNAKTLLRDLSQEVQVVYLVCHSSRATEQNANTNT